VSGGIVLTISFSPSSKRSDYAEKPHGYGQADKENATAMRHNRDPGIMGIMPISA
jgi:hypothetical protein